MAGTRSVGGALSRRRRQPLGEWPSRQRQLLQRARRADGRRTRPPAGGRPAGPAAGGRARPRPVDGLLCGGSGASSAGPSRFRDLPVVVVGVAGAGVRESPLAGVARALDPAVDDAGAASRGAVRARVPDAAPPTAAWISSAGCAPGSAVPPPRPSCRRWIAASGPTNLAAAACASPEPRRPTCRRPRRRCRSSACCSRRRC